MAELKSAFDAALERHFKSRPKPSKANDTVANAAITETQFYARERLAKNILANQAALRSSRFGRNGVIKGDQAGLFATGALPTAFGRNNAAEIFQQKMRKVASSLPPINFFPPAVVPSKAMLPKALRGMFHDAISGVVDTDTIASDKILNDRFERLERIREFGRATKSSGFARYAAAERRANQESDDRAEYENERLRSSRLAESRGSIRNRKERLAIMKEFPTFFKNSKMSTKDMRDIARTLRKIRKTPILKSMVFNPFASSAAFIGLQKAAFNISDAANKEITDWQNQALMTGGLSKELENAGYLAGLKSPGEMMQVLGKFQAKYGPAATDVLKGFGSTIAAAPAEQRMIVASRLGLDTKTSALAMAMSNPEMFQSDQRITQAARNKLEAVKTMGYSSGSSFFDTIGSLWLSMFAGAQARDARDFEYVNKDVNENYNEMMNRLVYVLDDVRKTAEADDQYAAGKFETYTDTTDNSKKEVNVQMNLGGVTVQPGGDARGFVDELMAISKNGMSQSRAVIDAFDTKRKK